jgi:DNA gyrase subunit A
VGVRSIITSDRNGNVVGALCVTDTDGMVMISSSGQTVRITMRDLRVMGRNTQGVKLVNLREGDYLVAIQKIEDTGENESNAEIPQSEDLPIPTDVVEESEEEVSEEGLQEINMAEDEQR